MKIRANLFQITSKNPHHSDLIIDYILCDSQKLSTAEQEYLLESAPDTQIIEIKALDKCSVAHSVIQQVHKVIKHEAQFDHIRKKTEIPDHSGDVWICRQCGWTNPSEWCYNCNSYEGQWVNREAFEPTPTDPDPANLPIIDPSAAPSPPEPQGQEAESEESCEDPQNPPTSLDSSEEDKPPEQH